jgi:hypothetical protein
METLRLFPSPPTADHPAFRVRPAGYDTGPKPRPANVFDIATFDADELAGMAMIINEQRALNTQNPSASIRTIHQQVIPHDYSKSSSSARYSRDSWSIHYDNTSQAPYIARSDDGLGGSKGLSKIPEGTASYELAEFLRTTAPNPPHRKPSKFDMPAKTTTASQHASHFMKLVHKSSIASSSRKKSVLCYLIIPRNHADSRLRLGSLLHRKGSSTTADKQDILPSKSFKQEVSRAGELA